MHDRAFCVSQEIGRTADSVEHAGSQGVGRVCVGVLEVALEESWKKRKRTRTMSTSNGVFMAMIPKRLIISGELVIWTEKSVFIVGPVYWQCKSANDYLKGWMRRALVEMIKSILVAIAKPSLPESKNRMKVSCNTSVHTITSSNGSSTSPPMMELATFPIPDWRGNRDLGRRSAETSEERNSMRWEADESRFGCLECALACFVWFCGFDDGYGAIGIDWDSFTTDPIFRMDDELERKLLLNEKNRNEMKTYVWLAVVGSVLFLLTNNYVFFWDVGYVVSKQIKWIDKVNHWPYEQIPQTSHQSSSFVNQPLSSALPNLAFLNNTVKSSLRDHNNTSPGTVVGWLSKLEPVSEGQLRERQRCRWWHAGGGGGDVTVESRGEAWGD